MSSSRTSPNVFLKRFIAVSNFSCLARDSSVVVGGSTGGGSVGVNGGVTGSVGGSMVVGVGV